MDFFSKFSEFADDFKSIQDEWNNMNRGSSRSRRHGPSIRGRPQPSSRRNPFASQENQSLDQIRETCLGEGIMFEDPEFEAVDTSIFFSQEPPRPFEWLRPHVSLFSLAGGRFKRPHIRQK